jgi:cellulose biosynthesis protein BcsQ
MRVAAQPDMTNSPRPSAVSFTSSQSGCGCATLSTGPNIRLACAAGPSNSWQIVHTWVRNLIEDIRESWNQNDITVFVDCNPSFTIYTELAIAAADRLIIPFSADGSSKRAVRSVLSLVYGIPRRAGQPQSEFNNKIKQFRMALPQIYAYVGNRLTQMNNSSAGAFRTVVLEIFT